MKNPQGDNVCKVSGEWNGQLEFTYSNVRFLEFSCKGILNEINVHCKLLVSHVRFISSMRTYVKTLFLQQGQNKVIDTATMKTIKKCVRPLALQSDNESRRLWQNVTNALKNNDINLATQHKRFVRQMTLLLSM